MEIFPSYARRRSLLVVIACTVYFICSVPFACPVGLHSSPASRESDVLHLLLPLGWHLSVRTVSRVHGKYLSGHGRFLRSGRRGSHLWFVIEHPRILEAERERFHLGFNRFLNDVKLMLGKRAAEYYLFVTLCVTAPLLTFVSVTIVSLEGEGGPAVLFFSVFFSCAKTDDCSFRSFL